MIALQSNTWPYVKTEGAHKLALLATALIPLFLVVSRAGAEIAVGLIDLLFLWQCYRHKSWGWVRAPFIKIGLLAWLWLLVAVTPFAINPAASLPQALVWGRLILLVAALRYWVLMEIRTMQWISYALLPILAFATVDTVWQFTHGQSLTGHMATEAGRLTGPFVAPKVGIFITKLLLVLMACLLAAWHVISSPTKKILPVVALGSLIAVMLTGERTAAIMLLGISAFVGVFTFLRVQEFRRSVMLYMILCFAILAGLLLTQSWVRGTVDRTMAHVSGFQESPYGKVFSMAIEVGEQNPISGVGLQGFRQVVADRFSEPAGKAKLGEKYLHPHNPYLEWFAEAGVPGCILFICLVGALLSESITAIRRAKNMQLVTASFFFGIILINFFPFMAVQSYFSNWAGILVWYTVGVAYAAASQRA